MTEDQIERKVERMTDKLDAALMNNQMTQQEYDAEMKALDLWTVQQYKVLEEFERLKGRME